MERRIFELRKSLKLSQADFADRLDLSRNFINQVEAGKKNISERTIKDICREFHVNEEWLRTGSGEMFDNTGEEGFVELASSLSDDPFVRAVVIEYSLLGEKERKLFSDFLKRLAARMDQPAPSDQEGGRDINVLTTEDEVEKRVEDYRRRLLLEKEAEEGSDVLRAGA